MITRGYISNDSVSVDQEAMREDANIMDRFLDVLSFTFNYV